MDLLGWCVAIAVLLCVSFVVFVVIDAGENPRKRRDRFESLFDLFDIDDD